jgi:hypothetical protein
VVKHSIAQHVPFHTNTNIKMVRPNTLISIADEVIYNSGRGPLSQSVKKNGSRPNPAHLLQLIIEMITVAAVEGYLVIWTIRQGYAVCKVQLSQGVVETVPTLIADTVQLSSRVTMMQISSLLRQ